MPSVPSRITKTAPTDTYGLTSARDNIGGFMSGFTAVGDWTTLPNDQREKGMLVSSIAAPQMIYQLGNDLSTWTLVTNILTFNSMADMVAYLGTLGASVAPAPLIFLRGYHATSPGIGAGFWYYDSTSTYTPNTAIKTVTAGGRMIPYFENGWMNVQKFGARPAPLNSGGATTVDYSAETNTAFVDVLNMQKDYANWPLRVIHVPASAGAYQITQKFSMDTAREVPLILIGDNRVSAPPNMRTKGGSEIRQMTSNPAGIGILEVCGELIRIEGLTFSYPPFGQTSTQTNSVCIGQVGAALMAKCRFANLAFVNCNRAIYFPDNGSSMANCHFEHIYVRSASVQAIHLGNDGTTNWGCDWYIQNNNTADASEAADITSCSRTANPLELEIVMTGTLPQALSAAGGIVTLSGINPFTTSAAISCVVKYLDIPTKTIRVDLLTDPGGAITLSSARVSCTPFGPQTECSVYIGSGCMLALTGADFEGSYGSNSTTKPIFLQNDGYLTIDMLHLEYAFPQANDISLVLNRGSLVLQTTRVTNIGKRSGNNVYVFTNDRLFVGAQAPFLSCDVLIASNLSTIGGGNHIVARSLNSQPAPIVQRMVSAGNARANVTNAPQWGNAVAYACVNTASADDAIGATGDLTIVAGNLTVV